MYHNALTSAQVPLDDELNCEHRGSPRQKADLMKKLACRLGRHQWTTRVEGGERYKVCAVCGKTPSDPPAPGPEKHADGPYKLPPGDVGPGDPY